MATILPNGKQAFSDAVGAPLVGGKVYTYAAGTSTPKPTYADAAGAVPNTNPVILDARGEATIFWSGAYKVTLRDAADNLIWTVDNISSAIDASQISYGSTTVAERLSRAAYLTETGGLALSGFVGEFNRADAALQINSFGGGHALLSMYNSTFTDEMAWTGYMPDSAGTDRQVFSIFSGMVQGINTVGSWVGYTGIHGGDSNGVSQDVTPWIAYMNNSMEVCCGTTNGTWNLRLTDANVFHNFQTSYLQGPTVMGLHQQSVDAGYILQANGFGFFGTVGAAPYRSTNGVTIGWSNSGGGTGLVQAYDLINSVFKPLQVNATELTLAQAGTKIGFFGTAPVVRPSITGSRGGNAALADLLTKLAATGLITDTTTA